MNELIKYTDPAVKDAMLLKEAIQVTRNLTWKINDEKRAMDVRKTMKQLESKISGLSQVDYTKPI